MDIYINNLSLHCLNFISINSRYRKYIDLYLETENRSRFVHVTTTVSYHHARRYINENSGHTV